jgi:hypothetical protein
MKALPRSPRKRKFVLSTVADTLTPFIDEPTALHLPSLVSPEVYLKVLHFYERDDISATSPRIRDFTNILDDNGARVQKQKVHY